METVPGGLAFGRLGRQSWQTSVRAAAVSATQLLVQRAALELDIAPEEFEALEPRMRAGNPVLQITDFLVNGAGFCRRLAEREPSGQRLIVRLMRSLVEEQTTNSFLAFSTKTIGKSAARHAICAFSAMETVVTTGSWTGVSASAFCGAYSNHRIESGLDGRWAEFPEIADWPGLASDLAAEIVRLRPGHMSVTTAGPLSLPVVSWDRGGSIERYVFVHPFWSLRAGQPESEFLRRTVAELGTGSVFFVDTFEAARRPVLALEASKGRPADTS